MREVISINGMFDLPVQARSFLLVHFGVSSFITNFNAKFFFFFDFSLQSVKLVVRLVMPVGNYIPLSTVLSRMDI